MPTLMDHLIIALLVVVVPLHGAYNYRLLKERVGRGDPRARIDEYRATVIQQWAVTAIVLLAWWRSGRAVEALGLALPADWRTALGLAIMAAGLGFLAIQWRAIVRLSGPALDSLRKQLAGAREMVPTNEAEHRWFRWVALTAGICEEVICRGYLVWYLAQYLGWWPGMVAAAVVFGLAHLYQGGRGVIKTGLVGVIFGATYLATGSLLWPMILHVAVDLQGGAVGRRLASVPSV